MTRLTAWTGYAIWGLITLAIFSGSHVNGIGFAIFSIVLFIFICRTR